ncbi:ATP-binding protein [Streptomyces sp. SD15]
MQRCMEPMLREPDAVGKGLHRTEGNSYQPRTPGVAVAMQPEPSDTHEITCRLPRRPSTVPRARALLHAVVGGWGVDQDVLDTAELVLSELVTNALQSRAPRDRQVGVRITHSEQEGLLRLEVSDAGEGRPKVRNPTEDETGGRGLLLVEALTDRWGMQEREGGIGQTVWVDIKAPDIRAVQVEREIAAVTSALAIRSSCGERGEQSAVSRASGLPRAGSSWCFGWTRAPRCGWTQPSR